MAMRLVGRVASAIAVLGAAGLAVALAVNPELGRPESPAIRWIDWVGLITVLCMSLSWILAMFHWGTNTALADRKRAWGFAVILGFFLGAAVYFYHPRGASSATSSRR
jgi:drug/metabolite transporter (DMT)-like permease